MDDRRYYVYVYIDPRNYEEFYYGKGLGSRRSAHLNQEGDSEKLKRISAIRKEGLEPLIRTVAAGLTEADAHLIETTLIWKLGRTLTNQAAGRYVSLFRPQNTLHKELPGFDFQSQVYYFNVGDSRHRKWQDCRQYGFLSAGQGLKWRNQILTINPGDMVVPYLRKHGFVGVGKVRARAVRYSEFRVGEEALDDLPLKATRMAENAANPEKSEYVLSVRWIKTFSRQQAKWKAKSGLYTTQLIRASLAKQPKTLAFVEKAFSLDLKELSI